MLIKFDVITGCKIFFELLSKNFISVDERTFIDIRQYLKVVEILISFDHDGNIVLSGIICLSGSVVKSHNKKITLENQKNHR